MGNLSTYPVAIPVHKWLSTDSIAADGTVDAGAPFALSNIIDETFGAVTFRGGRTTTAANPSGFSFELNAAISVDAAELVNTQASAGEDVEWRLNSSTTWNSGDVSVLQTTAWPQGSDIWTGYSGTLRTSPVRSNVLVGYDTVTIGPTPATPPTLGTIATVGSGRIHFSTPSSRTYWEASYLALGTGGRRLGELDQSTIGVAVTDLRTPAGGMGHRYTLNWPFMSTEDVAFLDGLWQGTSAGNFPAFLFPVPAQRSVSGLISGVDFSPGLRGGLVRLTSWSRKQATKVGSTWFASDCRLVAETWQEAT